MRIQQIVSLPLVVPLLLVNAMAVGVAAQATTDKSIAIGSNALATGYSSGADVTGATSVGGHSSAVGRGAVAMGYRTAASGDAVTAIGSDAVANKDGAVATGQRGIAIGSATNDIEGVSTGATTANGPQATGTDSIALGTSAQSSYFDTIAIGSNTLATTSKAIAIGERAKSQSAILWLSVLNQMYSPRRIVPLPLVKRR
ncbi:MAG: hypothetical protein SPG03_02495 [Veillonella caviae]|uniref:hypothetical protein n=1 Tax=Veillonella caviae TaxID=248316 RepID=UPI002A913C92|nr:hypothetical protein [Veillonella caviae]MDY5481248.1 hypothetical protein [Veillonella caviae]